jgi:hypothetical protein
MRDAKKMLDEIVEFLNVPDQAGQDLWLILTALRSSDSNQEPEFKKKTTARFRHLIGIREYEEGAGNQCYFFSSPGEPLDDKYIANSSFHFVNHYSTAINVAKRLGYVAEPIVSEVE